MKKIALVLITMIFGLALIYNVEASVSQTGSISGSVTEASGGAPIEFAQIYLLNTNFDHLTHVTSQADGSYQVTGLNSGDYYLAIHASGYGGLYFDNEYDNPTATIVHVTEPNDTSGIDFQLSPEATVSGFVYEADGTTPIASAQIEIWPRNGGQIQGATSDVNGSYTVEGLSTGSYVAKAEANGYTYEFFQEATSWSTSTPIAVSQPNNTPGINFTLEKGGTVAGTVLAEVDGTPLQNIAVRVQRVDDFRWWYDCTDQNGEYRVEGMSYGEYKVQARVSINCGIQSDYLKEYWQEKKDWDTANIITIEETNLNITDIDFTLELGGRITGKILLADGVTPVKNACVSISSTAPQTNIISRWETNNEGEFILYGVPTDIIYLRTKADCWNENLSLQDEWYTSGGSTPDANLAEPIMLTPGQTMTDVVFMLDDAAMTMVSPEQGGVLSTTVGISTTLDFPPNAVTETLTVTYKIIESHLISPGLQFLGQSFSIEAVTGNGTPVTTFTEPFTLTINYSDADVVGLDEESLKLYFWNSQTGSREEVPATVDVETNTITAFLDHLTDFSVIGDIDNWVYLPVILSNR